MRPSLAIPGTRLPAVPYLPPGIREIVEGLTARDPISWNKSFLIPARAIGRGSMIGNGHWAVTTAIIATILLVAGQPMYPQDTSSLAELQPEKIAKLREKGEKGDPVAQFTLGLMCSFGQGNPQDCQEEADV